MPLKIGLLVRNFEERGGIAVYTRELLSELFRIDHENEYSVFYGNESSLGTFGDHDNVTEIHVPCRSKLWWDQVQIARKANRLNLDLVFSPKMSLPFLFRGRKLLTIHGAEQFVFPEEFPLLDRLYVKLCLPLYARVADKVLTASHTSKRDLCRPLGVPISKFAVAYYGSKSVFGAPTTPEQIAEVRRKHGLEGDFVLHVGLVWGAKNFDIFPDVLARVNRARPLVLAHAGKAYRWGDAAASSEQSPHLKELGFVPDEDLAALYQSAVALVFPSLYEGFGIPLAEAMSAGCPIVTSDWGAMKEVTGPAALHVDSRDPDAIAQAIIRLLEEDGLREKLSAAGRQRSAQFSWGETARQTLAVFEESPE